MTEEELLPFCECGKCGLRVTKRGNRFVHGHNMQGKHHTQKSKEKMSKTKTGIPKPPRSPEHCAAMSAAQKDVPHTSEAQIAADEAKRGVPHSPERCAAISNGLKNSDAVKAHNESMRGVRISPEHSAAISRGMKNSEDVKANAEKMRGGMDIVNHHYLYDHSDLTLNTIQMTRSDHMKLHMLLKKLDYIVPHINVKEVI